jgi:hypothetical protein
MPRSRYQLPDDNNAFFGCLFAALLLLTLAAIVVIYRIT